jgi:hypothetical protein
LCLALVEGQVVVGGQVVVAILAVALVAQPVQS